MADLRKRAPEGTLQQRVFRALADRSASAHMIAEIIGHDVESCRKAVLYLIARGCLERHYVHCRLTIYSRRPRAHEPADRRGKPAACRNHRGQAAYAKWLLAMKAKHGPNWRPKPKTIALEEVWPITRAA
jgi:hypothetical protein